MNGGGANIIWESVEWFGQGLNANGNNNSETYFVYDSTAYQCYDQPQLFA